MEKERDIFYTQKCINLANQAYVEDQDTPFACIIVLKNRIVAKAKNCSQRGDITKHAEILALKKAQKKLNTDNLSNCSLYTNVEPCPMCAFMIRELKISRVCFSLTSKKMGGYSKWPILQDKSLSKITPFGKPPTIIKGILLGEAIKDFKKLGWSVFNQ